MCIRDRLYGHRNDPQGYAAALQDFDASLTEILPLIGQDDLLIITADHGNDPTTKSTDHNREFVPIISYNPQLVPRPLGERQTMADIGATIYQWLTGAAFTTGKSWL